MGFQASQRQKMNASGMAEFTASVPPPGAIKPLTMRGLSPSFPSEFPRQAPQRHPFSEVQDTMFKRLSMLVLALVWVMPAHAILLGNHHMSFDLVGSTEYFEFADFQEWELPDEVTTGGGLVIPLDDLNWGFGIYDLNPNVNPESWDDTMDIDDPRQNRNVIKMKFQGNLDLGFRLRSALSPRLGIEGYLKYTPADLVIDFNNNTVPSASFTRYQGVTNPYDDSSNLNWVEGEFPTYHIFRFGVNLDYVYFRSNNNVWNFYGSVGAGAVAYHRSGNLLVPVDYDSDSQDYPAAPRDITWLLPNDTFPSLSIGTGGIFFLHRYFGLNFDIRANWTTFEFKRAAFESQSHWIMGASLGYSIRL